MRAPPDAELPEAGCDPLCAEKLDAGRCYVRCGDTCCRFDGGQ